MAEVRVGEERVMSGYEELAGGDRAKVAKSWRTVIADYRKILYMDGQERLRENEGTRTVEVARRGVSKEESEKVLKAGGKLSLAGLLAHKVRYFVDGGVIGGREFVGEVFQEKRARFGPKRTTGARPIRQCEAPLISLRDLKVRAIEQARTEGGPFVAPLGRGRRRYVWMADALLRTKGGEAAAGMQVEREGAAIHRHGGEGGVVAGGRGGVSAHRFIRKTDSGGERKEGSNRATAGAESGDGHGSRGLGVGSGLGCF